MCAKFYIYCIFLVQIEQSNKMKNFLFTFTKFWN